MTVITAALVKELRDRTGVGMAKCKEALEEAKGDVELAIANLRKAGMASAVKKEGRTTNEGVITVGENASAIAFLEVNSETDFVARNDRFQQFVAVLAAEIAKTQPTSLEKFLEHSFDYDKHTMTTDQHRAILVQAIGENIQLKRLLVWPKAANKSIGVYSHLGGKIVCLVELTGSSGEEAFAKELAMHVAAAAPEYLSPETVPADILNNERDIAKGQLQGKPANMIDKIVEGKLEAFYGTSCLSKQKYIKDDALTVAQVIEKHSKETGKPLQLTGFIRWSLNQI